MSLRLATAAGVVIAAALMAGCSGQPPAKHQLTVYAAASLTASFTELVDAFAEEHPEIEVRPIVFDGSSTLATQLIEGAAADVFASADVTTMTRVDDAGLLADRPAAFATNVLQIAVAPGNPRSIRGLADLANPAIDVVLCSPEVPCGAAARTLLSAAGSAVVPASEEQNVTAVATKVRLGEADAGLVYATDILESPGELDGVTILDAGQAVTRYAIGVLASSGNQAAAAEFVKWVRSAEGQGILADHGFGRP